MMNSYSKDAESHLRAAYASAYDIHGDIDLAYEDYRDYILAICEKRGSAGEFDEDSTGLISRLHTGDLYLVAGCAIGAGRAWSRLESLYKRYVDSIVRKFCSWAASDVACEIWTDLFLPDRSGRSRIASYDGRSSLTTWLYTVVSNRAVNAIGRKSNTFSRPENWDHVAAYRDTAADTNLWRQRYEPLLAAALRRACASLDDGERSMLVWRFDEGLQLSDIAQVLDVHCSTVGRRIDRVLAGIRKIVVADLSGAGLSPEAVEECLSLLVASNSHSVSFIDMLKKDLVSRPFAYARAA